MKLKLCLLVYLCLYFSAFAQPKRTLKSLTIGDTVSGIIFSNLVNSTRPSIPLTEFHHKLVIIDFWATYCPPCLALLPRYDSLQRTFGDSIQFMLSTHETKKIAAAFLSRHHYLLPSVTTDFELAKAFPHVGVPFEVWIRDGKVLATTFGDDVNEQSIRAALKHQQPDIHIERQDVSYRGTEPLLLNGNGGNATLLTYSLLIPYQSSIRSHTSYYRDSTKVFMCAVNMEPAFLYQFAFAPSDELLTYRNRLVLDLPDSLRNIITRPAGAKRDAWTKRYTYCYNLVLPADFKGNLAQQAAADLNRYFEPHYGIHGSVEKRTVRCYVLSRIPGSVDLSALPGTPVLASDSTHFLLKNLPFRNFVLGLARVFSKADYPLIDETGYSAPVDLSVNARLDDFDALRQDLRKSGIELSIKEKTIDMVVIRQLKPSTTNP